MAKNNDVTKCEVCGRALPSMSKALTCSAKCRKRKSRYAEVGNLAMIARQNIREMIKGLELDVVTCAKLQDEFYALRDVMDALATAYNARWDREHATGELDSLVPVRRTRKGSR